MRQMAVYQKFISDTQSTWVLIGASVAVEEQLDRYYKLPKSAEFTNPLEPHLLILDLAMANWRPYMVWLTDDLNRLVTTSADHAQYFLLTSVADRQISRCVNRQVVGGVY